MTWDEIRKLHPDLPESSEGWHQHPNGGGWVNKNAVIHNDRIYIGERAVIRGGEFHGGEFYGGEFYGGDFYGGDFYGGEFRDSEFHDGVWHRGPVFICGATRHVVCEVGPDEFKIGCKRGKISERDTLLPQWFAKHNTPLEMQPLYTAAVELIAAKAAQDTIKETKSES